MARFDQIIHHAWQEMALHHHPSPSPIVPITPEECVYTNDSHYPCSRRVCVSYLPCCQFSTITESSIFHAPQLRKSPFDRAPNSNMHGEFKYAISCKFRQIKTNVAKYFIHPHNCSCGIESRQMYWWIHFKHRNRKVNPHPTPRQPSLC